MQINKREYKLINYENYWYFFVQYNLFIFITRGIIRNSSKHLSKLNKIRFNDNLKMIVKVFMIFTRL